MGARQRPAADERSGNQIKRQAEAQPVTRHIRVGQGGVVEAVQHARSCECANTTVSRKLRLNLIESARNPTSTPFALRQAGRTPLKRPLGLRRLQLLRPPDGSRGTAGVGPHARGPTSGVAAGRHVLRTSPAARRAAAPPMEEAPQRSAVNGIANAMPPRHTEAAPRIHRPAVPVRRAARAG